MTFNPFFCLTSWCQRRHDAALKKIDMHIRVEEAKATAMIERMKVAEPGTDAWETLTVLQGGWRDDYVTILFTAAMVLCVLPWSQPIMVGAFAVMAQAPLWFQISGLTIIGAAFGMRLFNNLNEVVKK